MSDLHRQAYRPGEYLLQLTLTWPAKDLTVEQREVLFENAHTSLDTLLRVLHMQEVP